MKLETYLKYRDLFESRYGMKFTLCGENVLKPMLEGIRHKHLFFMIYSYDRRISSGTQGVSSIDKHIRYYTYLGNSCTRIRKPSFRVSMVDRFGDYEKIFTHCISTLNKKGIKTRISAKQ